MFRTIGFRFSGTAVSPHKNIQTYPDITNFNYLFINRASV